METKKVYSVWAELKDGSKNGYWLNDAEWKFESIADAQDCAQRFNRYYPDRNYRAREYEDSKS